jgi:hypothetical protein
MSDASDFTAQQLHRREQTSTKETHQKKKEAPKRKVMEMNLQV